MKKALNIEKRRKKEINSIIEFQVYYTDEEELNRETDRVLKKKRPYKKRKAKGSPEVEQTKTERILKDDGQKRMQPREKQPPPINIVGITNYTEIQSLMKSKTDKEHRIIALNNNVWKINTQDSDKYRALAKKLNDNAIQWYTYEDKSRRPNKVMRGLHATCAKEEIMQKVLKILDAINIIKKERKINDQGNQAINKRELPLFMLTFDNQEKAENIYNIKSILSMKVKIEPLRKTTNLISQYKRCQSYNHTQAYCSRELRCVKCAGKHLTSICIIRKNIPPKCVNYKGQHPTNYRGYEIATELQKIRNQERNS